MFHVSKSLSRLLITCVLAGVLGVGMYAYTAANVVPASKAGDGAEAITGYTITNVDYVLNGTNPQNIDSVTFDLDSTPTVGSDIEIKLVAAGTDWYSCTNILAAIACVTTAPQATVAPADELRVVVAD